MPGDVTGSLVYDAHGRVRVPGGPVFTNLMLADEINRTPPKTQAALLEAMEERQVSVDGEPRPLRTRSSWPPPRTRSSEGTYQLPEAQLDRFLLKLNVPLPPRDQEIAILSRHAHGFDPRDLSAIRPVAGAGSAHRARGRPAGSGRRRGARLHRRHRRRHPELPLLQLGVSPRGRRHCSAPRRRGRGCPARSYVTPMTSGDGPAHPAASGGPAPRGRTRGRQPGRGAGRHPVGGSGAALVILTGRAGLVALIYVLRSRCHLVGNHFRADAGHTGRRGTVDVLLAAARAPCASPGFGETAARLGQPVEAHLRYKRGLPPVPRGMLRDAWPPSRAAPSHAASASSSRRPATHRHERAELLRRGDQESAVVTAAPIGPLGLAGRQRFHHPVPGRIASCRRSCRESACRPGWRSCADRQPVAVLIRGHGTEFDSLREYVDVTTCAPSTAGHRPPGRCRGATWRPGATRRVIIVLDTGRTSAAGSVDPTSRDLAAGPGWTWGWTPLCCWRPWRRGPVTRGFLAHDRVSRAAVFGASHRTTGAACRKPWPAGPHGRIRTPPQWWRRCSMPGPPAALVVC